MAGAADGQRLSVTVAASQFLRYIGRQAQADALLTGLLEDPQFAGQPRFQHLRSQARQLLGLGP